MKNWFFLGVFSAAFLTLASPAHAKGLGLIGDLWELGQNVANGTIPLPYVLAFVALIVVIGILGAFEARKNARKAAEEGASNSSSIDLTK